MAFITTQCQKSKYQDPEAIGPEDSCFDLPMDHIRELLAELGERPKQETSEEIKQRLQTVTRILEDQERKYLEHHHNEAIPDSH